VVDFADFGDGAPEELLQRAESALGFKFPPSYRWWLRSYGGGEVLGEEIYSLYETPGPSGDVVYQHELNQTKGLLGPRQLVICHSDVDGMFYLDIAGEKPGAEAPVISQALGTVYAQDFSEFLYKRIRLAED